MGEYHQGQQNYLPPFVCSSFSFIRDKDRYLLINDLKKSDRGWHFLSHSRLQVWPGANYHIRLSEPNGMTLDFSVSRNGPPNATLISSAVGISNLGQNLPNGKCDPRNTRISISGDGTHIIVYSFEGTARHYHYSTRVSLFCHYYYLEKEILPNGKVLKYHFKSNRLLESIVSLDPQERCVYASIHADIQQSQSEKTCRFTSSSGPSATMRFQTRHEMLKWKMSKKEKYKYGLFSPYFLSSVDSPFFRHESMGYNSRFLLDLCLGKDQIFSCTYAPVPTPSSRSWHERIQKLLFPIGENDSFQVVSELSYDPPHPGKKAGTTHVKNCDGTAVIYHFSPNLLVTSIHHYDRQGNLAKQKTFQWSDNGYLLSTELKSGQGNLFYRRSYENYDAFGNPGREVFFGNLTGEGGEQSYWIHREYSTDSRSLLLKEEKEDGTTVCYEYLPNTHLLTAKLTKGNEKILLREFYDYDDFNNLIGKTFDDGSSPDKNDLFEVTQRTITEYILKQTQPYLHMPEWIEEKYLEDGNEKLLKKVFLHYDASGNVKQEDHFDAKAEFTFSIFKEYNERGDLLSETNPIGQKTTYDYDPRGRPIQRTFSTLKETATYDLRGRLKERSQISDDNQIHTTNYAYDHNDACIQKTDYLRNSTSYEHDPIAKKCIRTTHPLLLSPNADPQPVIMSSIYDSSGCEIAKTDANGHTTTLSYNAYGDPTELNHADGGKDTYLYYKNGKLKSHTDPDGLTIAYQYDILDRVTSKTYSKESTFLAEETFSYNHYHLLSHTDKEGYVTLYSYDKVGRKSSEERENRKTEFFYDHLGMLACISKEGILFTYYKRDLLNRIAEETATDASGTVLHKMGYAYDDNGNRSEITRFIHNIPATETFRYDSFDRLLEHQDALEATTTTHYNETFVNSLNQRVLQATSIDPERVVAISTQDAFGRIVKQDTLDMDNRILSSEESLYDACGNLVEQRIPIFEEGALIKTQTIRYFYDSKNRLKQRIRAFGADEERHEQYTYTLGGRRETKTVATGTVIHYGYDGLGYLTSITTSDSKIDYLYVKDRLGFLKSASDLLKSITIQREYDPFGNMLWEKIDDRFLLQKDYDDLNRPLAVILPDRSEIRYTYDPFYLKKVRRISSSGQEVYSHSYDEYDLAGNLLAESMIGDLGQIQHSYDPKGRKKSIHGAWFAQQCAYDLRDNLRIINTDGVDGSYTYDGLSQLTTEPNQIYTFDSNHNRTSKNGQRQEYNALDELLACSYDLNGNLTSGSLEPFIFTFDPLNQLIDAKSDKTKVIFSYDPLGRRLRKTVYSLTETACEQTADQLYLYDSNQELGAFTPEGKVQQLRIPGLPLQKDIAPAVAVELNGRLFVPVNDFQGNTRKLLDPATRKIVDSYDFTAFGERLNQTSENTPFNPWWYACKRLDPELGLLYFGKRFYDPRLGRWLSTDPAGFIDSLNLYQYVLNNPFRYVDPDGQFLALLALAIPLIEIAIPTLTIALPTITQVGMLLGAAVIAGAGYEVAKAVNKRDDKENSRLTTLNSNVLDETKEDTKKKKKGYNTNPFEGPVDEEVVVVDENGNAIPVPEGHQLGGSKDGKCIELKTNENDSTGLRKDGKGHPKGPKHPDDPRAWDPHAHVPGVTNPDGTPWLPIH